MRARLFVLVTTLATAAGTARADRPIRLGSVTGKVARPAVEAALDGAFRGMTPCFRKATGTLKVAVEVGTDGEVVHATAAGKGGAGQCVAGLLAVTPFPAGAGWKATIEVDAVTTEQWLSSQLATHQGELSACQTKDPSGKGDVVLQLAIASSGTITAATVDKAGAGKAIADCAKAAALAIKLEPVLGGTAVNYRMVVAYGGGSAGAGHGSGAATPAEPAGSSGGALAGNVIQETWVAQRAKVLACGAKLTKASALTVSFRVRADGTVKNVVLKKSSVGDKAIEDCVDKALRALTFPAASGETQVNLPITWAKK